MNSKESLKNVQNFYDGENIGRDSPAALLDMLAEVASQTLHSEKEQREKTVAGKSRIKSECLKRKNQDLTFNVLQLLSMPTTQLIKQFSIFTSDELKRQYSYVCALMPDCGQKYTSFASESRARMSIKTHLEDHLEFLKTNQDAYTTFTATASKKTRTNLQNKKSKAPRTKKPQEVVNKENKDIKLEKPTNYLRKILTNEFKSSPEENQKINPIDLKKEEEEVDEKVLGDHSYYESTKDGEFLENLTSTDSNEIVPQPCNENIMLMVVQSDGVHMKEVPYVTQKREDLTQEPIYLPEPVQTEEVYARNMESPVPAKPKGKAKFIGTSREEKEMALLLMDRIKKKGNPSGNNLQCRICDPPRTFTAPTTLVSHYRSHAGIKPYECRICRSVFTRRHSLKYHMLIHQNQTRFTCTDCGKKFRHPSHFREHRRRHTGEAPFGCEDCGQRFKTRNTYKRHLKTRHGKVLTTSGELLHLSEEDFQKVRTNRRKKSPLTVESIIDEDATASEAILQYEDSNCDTQENQDQNYKDFNQYESEEGTVWMTENIIQDIKKEKKFQEFDIESRTESENEIENDESCVNKTDDFVETEVDTGNEEFHSDHLFETIDEQICDEESSTILDETVDTNLDLVKQTVEILYEKPFEESEELYNVDEYENQMENLEGEEILGYEEQILHDVDVIQEVQIENEDESQNFDNDSSMNIFCNNEEVEEAEEEVEEVEENHLLENDNSLENEALSVEEPEDFINREEEILGTESILDYDNDEELEENNDTEVFDVSQMKQEQIDEQYFFNGLNNSQAESVFSLNLDQKEKVRVEPCGVPLSNFQSQSFQITKDGKMTIFGKQPQTINLMQNESAILFLSNGTELPKNYLKINQNGILVKELKSLPIAASNE